MGRRRYMLDLATDMTKLRAWHLVIDHYTKCSNYVKLRIEPDHYLTLISPSLAES